MTIAKQIRVATVASGAASTDKAPQYFSTTRESLSHQHAQFVTQNEFGKAHLEEISINPLGEMQFTIISQRYLKSCVGGRRGLRLTTKMHEAPDSSRGLGIRFGITSRYSVRSDAVARWASLAGALA
jgi:hypothetical protein